MKLKSLLATSFLASGLILSSAAYANLVLTNSTKDVAVIYPFCGPLGTPASSAKAGIPIKQSQTVTLSWALISTLVLDGKQQGVCYFFQDKGKTLPIATADVNIDSGMQSGSITNIQFQDTTHTGTVSAPGTNVTVDIESK